MRLDDVEVGAEELGALCDPGKGLGFDAIKLLVRSVGTAVDDDVVD